MRIHTIPLVLNLAKPYNIILGNVVCELSNHSYFGISLHVEEMRLKDVDISYLVKRCMGAHERK